MFISFFVFIFCHFLLIKLIILLNLRIYKKKMIFIIELLMRSGRDRMKNILKLQSLLFSRDNSWFFCHVDATKLQFLENNRQIKPQMKQTWSFWASIVSQTPVIYRKAENGHVYFSHYLYFLPLSFDNMLIYVMISGVCWRFIRKKLLFCTDLSHNHWRIWTEGRI